MEGLDHVINNHILSFDGLMTIFGGILTILFGIILFFIKGLIADMKSTAHDLSQFKLYVAERYLENRHIEDLRKAIDGLTKRIDQMYSMLNERR